MVDGWIKLHRNIQEHWLWKDEPYDKARAWIDLLLLANHEDKKMAYKGEVIVCKRGTVNRSILSLSERWRWSRDKTTRFLRLLESDGMCEVDATTNRTTITIVNYDFYQCQDTMDKATSNATNKATSRQRADTNKNDKNDKNDKNVNNIIPCVVDYLNQRCGSNYRATTEKTQKCIKARLGEGYTLDDFKVVIDKKVDSWLHNEKMSQYLRPETLFGTKFESYLNEKVVKESPVKKGNKFNEMIHTDYDFDALEKQLLGE